MELGDIYNITCRGYSPRLDFTNNDYRKYKGAPESILILMYAEFHVLPCSLLRDGATESRGYLYVDTPQPRGNRR